MKSKGVQVPTPAAPADVTSATTGVIMQPEYAQAVGRMAYLWGWPMVNQLNRSAAITLAPGDGGNTEEEMKAFTERRPL
jgi:hypothetical protein